MVSSAYTCGVSHHLNEHQLCVVTQQTVNNNSYNYPPNYSIFPEVI
jgi:hypothetical protein